MNSITKKKKITAVLTVLFLTICSNSAFAQADPPPPTAPINDYIVPMMIVAIVIASVYFYNKTKKAQL